MHSYINDHQDLPPDAQEGLLDFARSFGLVKRDMESPTGPAPARTMRPLQLTVLNNAYQLTSHTLTLAGQARQVNAHQANARQTNGQVQGALPRMMTGFGTGHINAHHAADQMMQFSAMIGQASTRQALEPANVMLAAERFGPGGPMVAGAFLRGAELKQEAASRGLLDHDGDVKDLPVSDEEVEHTSSVLFAGCDSDSDAGSEIGSDAESDAGSDTEMATND